MRRQTTISGWKNLCDIIVITIVPRFTIDLKLEQKGAWIFYQIIHQFCFFLESQLITIVNWDDGIIYMYRFNIDLLIEYSWKLCLLFSVLYCIHIMHWSIHRYTATVSLQYFIMFTTISDCINLLCYEYLLLLNIT